MEIRSKRAFDRKGRVFNYNYSLNFNGEEFTLRKTPGIQDGRTFAVWDPAQGFAGGHVTLAGVVGVNSFCAAQAFRADGSMLIAGGIFDNGNDKGSVVLNNTATGVTASVTSRITRIPPRVRRIRKRIMMRSPARRHTGGGRADSSLRG